MTSGLRRALRQVSDGRGSNMSCSGPNCKVRDRHRSKLHCPHMLLRASRPSKMRERSQYQSFWGVVYPGGWSQVFILLIITFGVIVGAIATVSVITKCG